MKSMITELNYYKKRLENVIEELKTLPSGHLVRRGNLYYHAVNGRQIGITRNTELIIKLYRKKYLIKLEKDLNYDIRVISNCIKRLRLKSPQEMIHSFSNVYKGLPASHFFHPSVKPWLVEQYKTNTFPLSGQTFTSIKGIKYRSKSELLIGNELNNYNIPNRYDAEINLDNQTKYADFLIKAPYNGKLIIWEHLGALDYSGYTESMNEKLSLYRNHGFIPFKNLIYTFECDVMEIRNIQRLIEDIILKP